MVMMLSPRTPWPAAPPTPGLGRCLVMSSASSAAVARPQAKPLSPFGVPSAAAGQPQQQSTLLAQQAPQNSRSHPHQQNHSPQPGQQVQQQQQLQPQTQPQPQQQPPRAAFSSKESLREGCHTSSAGCVPRPHRQSSPPSFSAAVWGGGNATQASEMPQIPDETKQKDMVRVAEVISAGMIATKPQVTSPHGSTRFTTQSSVAAATSPRQSIHVGAAMVSRAPGPAPWTVRQTVPARSVTVSSPRTNNLMKQELHTQKQTSRSTLSAAVSASVARPMHGSSPHGASRMTPSPRPAPAPSVSSVFPAGSPVSSVARMVSGAVEQAARDPAQNFSVGTPSPGTCVAVGGGGVSPVLVSSEPSARGSSPSLACLRETPVATATGLEHTAVQYHRGLSPSPPPSARPEGAHAQILRVRSPIVVARPRHSFAHSSSTSALVTTVQRAVLDTKASPHSSVTSLPVPLASPMTQSAEMFARLRGPSLEVSPTRQRVMERSSSWFAQGSTPHVVVRSITAAPVEQAPDASRQCVLTRMSSGPSRVAWSSAGPALVGGRIHQSGGNYGPVPPSPGARRYELSPSASEGVLATPTLLNHRSPKLSERSAFRSCSYDSEHSRSNRTQRSASPTLSTSPPFSARAEPGPGQCWPPASPPRSSVATRPPPLVGAADIMLESSCPSEAPTVPQTPTLTRAHGANVSQWDSSRGDNDTLCGGSTVTDPKWDSEVGAIGHESVKVDRAPPDWSSNLEFADAIADRRAGDSQCADWRRSEVPPNNSSYDLEPIVDTRGSDVNGSAASEAGQVAGGRGVGRIEVDMFLD